MCAEIADETIRRMLDVVDQDWHLRAASTPERGTCSVYYIDVETPVGVREWVLKASPDGDDWGIPVEARIMSILRAQTDIPVPEVLGVVDDHRDLPSPYFLMDRMPESNVSYDEFGRLPNDVIRTTATQVGQYLGELHRLDAVDSFGYVNCDKTPELLGECPSGSTSDVSIPDWDGSWHQFLDGWVESELEQHPDTPLGQLTSRIESWSRDRIEALSNLATPVVGWNDHGYHNLLFNPETGDVTGMIDWGYTLAVTPAFDFQYAEYLFSGTYLSAIPDVPDRREIVRTAMLDGYRSKAPDLARDVSQKRPLYELLAMVRVTNIHAWNPEIFGDSGDIVAEGLRDDIEQLLRETA